jgi:hypothetical protein
MPTFVITTERVHESLLALFGRYAPAAAGHPQDLAKHLAALDEGDAEPSEVWMMFEVQPDDSDPSILVHAVLEGIEEKGVFSLDLEAHRTSIATAQAVAREANLALSVTVVFRPDPSA